MVKHPVIHLPPTQTTIIQSTHTHTHLRTLLLPHKPLNYAHIYTHTHTNLDATTNTTALAATAQAVVLGDDDLLPREPCLQALAALRHAKWFQVCFHLKIYTTLPLYFLTKVHCPTNLQILSHIHTYKQPHTHLTSGLNASPSGSKPHPKKKQTKPSRNQLMILFYKSTI